MSKTVDIFIALLRSAITETKEEINFSDADFESLFSLAKFHDLAHIVYFELKRRGQLPEGDVCKKFKMQYDMSIFRHAKRMMAIAQIRETLEKAQIPFILLKGVALMNLYPEPWMRTSSDVDVLVREEDKSKAEQLFLEAGFNREYEGQYDISFFTQNHFHVELHYTSLEDYTSIKQSRVMEKAWDYSVQKRTDAFEYVMLDEVFYFYHIAHMAKHFRNGGNGVRTIIDTWLLNHQIVFDQTKRDVLLDKGGLRIFDRYAKELSEKWFCCINPSEPVEDFEEYIISGGVYGKTERNTAIRKKKTNNTLKYYLKRIFLPYSSIKHSYPILYKVPILLPFCWIVRWCKLLNPNVRRDAMNEMKEDGSNDIISIEKIEALMKGLEIW